MAQAATDSSDTDDDRPKRFKIVATYDYTDESGTLLFQVCRLEPKSFRQRRRARPDDPPNKVKDGWVWSVKGVRQVPFRLPELIEALTLEHRLFVVEGEKDVLTLARHGIPATCNAGGAHKWDPAFAEHLAGADVIVIPDNDKDGHEHAQEVARSLAGKAARIRLLGAARPRRQGRRKRLVRRRRHRRGLQRAGRPGARLDRQRHASVRRDSATQRSHPARHRIRRPEHEQQEGLARAPSSRHRRDQRLVWRTGLRQVGGDRGPRPARCGRPRLARAPGETMRCAVCGARTRQRGAAPRHCLGARTRPLTRATAVQGDPRAARLPRPAGCRRHRRHARGPGAAPRLRSWSDHRRHREPRAVRRRRKLARRTWAP